jgi:hypothetical protein
MSRLDKLKEQHPELNVSVMDVIAKLDPTKTYKYTEFLVKKFKEFYDEYDDWMIGLGIEMMGRENMESLNEFEIHAKANRITNPDISQYKDFNQIHNAVEEAEEKVRLKELEKQVIKLYDDDEWSVVIPLSYEASKTYGANTKWCTTQERYWNEYYKTYKLIYIQNKKTNEKYAVSRHWEDNKKVQAWMSNDDESSPMLLPLPIEVMSVILCEVNKTDTIFELQSKHNIVEGDKPKKAYASYIDTDLDSYLNQYSRNDMEVTRRSTINDNIYNPYVSSSSGWGFEDNNGLSMRDILRRLTTTD